MDIIRTGIDITKTIKNVARLREILSVLAKNGFDEFIIKSGLLGRIPGFVLPKKRIEASLEETKDMDIWTSIGVRLKNSFDELGPSFIKLGQLLATREDIFPPQFILEMKKLQNQVTGGDFNEYKDYVERALGQPTSNIFSEITEEPIGVASIGLVYKAKLKSGEDVVLKVRKPGIKKHIINDFEILVFLTQQAEKISDDIKYLGLSRVLEDFLKSVLLELNFNIEANNCNKLKTNTDKVDTDKVLFLPKIYKEYSNEKVMVMELLDGTPFNKLSPEQVNDELRAKLLKSTKLFLHSLLADGFFHADLHGGNFFSMPNGQIGIIDFGLMGVLSKKSRGNLVAILYFLVQNNYENLVYEFLDVAEYDTIPDQDALIRDIKDSLTPFVGLSVQETNVSELISAIIKTLPREWFVIFRALMTLDGVGKSINIDLNIFEIIDGDIQEIMKEIMNQDSLKEELLWVGRDVLNSLRELPRHVRWFTKETAKSNYTFKLEIKHLKPSIESFTDSMYFLAHSIGMAVFVLTGTMFSYQKEITHVRDLPIISIVFWAIAAIIFVKMTYQHRKKVLK
jgi:ubiquinone biosynthesis protein